MKFCDACGAPVTERDVFCERCGALVGDDDTQRVVTQRMPRPDRPARHSHAEVHPPIPIMDMPEEQRRHSPSPSHPQASVAGERRGQGTQKATTPDKGRKDQGAVGWVVAGVLAIAVAVLIGYMMGAMRPTQRQDGTSSGNEANDVRWSSTVRGDDTGKADQAERSDGDAKSPDKGATGNSETQGTGSATETKKDTETQGEDGASAEQNEKKPAESVEERRLRESVGTEMAVRPDGQLRLSVSVPTDNRGLSERVEVEQDGEIVYSSRILAPGESLDWVPAEGAHAGSARVTVYGISGERDYGRPVTVEVSLIGE